MPTQPPRFRPPGWKPPQPWGTTRRSRQARGYGAVHDAMRKIVLAEEPLCRDCLAEGLEHPRRTTIADHIVPKAEGGTNRRSNYQGLCDLHSKRKTAREAARGRQRERDA